MFEHKITEYQVAFYLALNPKLSATVTSLMQLSHIRDKNSMPGLDLGPYLAKFFPKFHTPAFLSPAAN